MRRFGPWLAILLALALSGVDCETAAAQTPAVAPSPFSVWTSTVNRRLLATVRSPAHAPKATGRVEITFTVDRTGKVTNSAIKTSSGYEVYDKAAMLALTKAQPFPPIPPSANRDEVVLAQAFRFVYDPPPPPRHQAKTHE